MRAYARPVKFAAFGWQTLMVALVLLFVMVDIPRASATVASGQTTVFSSESAFLAALGAQAQVPVTATFNGVSASNADTTVSFPYSVAGMTISSPTATSGFINGANLYGSGYNYGTGDTLGAYNSDETNAALTVSFPAGTDAFGFDLGDFNGDSYTITLSDNETFQISAGQPLPGSGPTFFGVICPSGIASVTITPSGGNGEANDNLTYAMPASQISIPQYTVEDLGTPPNSDTDFYPTGTGLTDTSEAYGTFTATNYYTHGFAYVPGVGMMDMGSLGGQNNGFSQPAQFGFGLAYSDGNGADVPFLPFSPADVANNTGQITGYSEYEDSSDNYHTDAFLWDPVNGMTDLGTLDGSNDQSSYGYGINGFGEVAGGSGGGGFAAVARPSSRGKGPLAATSGATSGAFLWIPNSANGTSGSLIGLGSLGSSPFASQSVANSINSYGEVAGSSPASSFEQHAFLWAPTTANGADGQMYDLGTLDTNSSDDPWSYGYAIDDLGDVAGVSLTASGPNPFTGGKYVRGFLWIPSAPNSTTGGLSDIGSLSTNFPGSYAVALANGIVTGESLVDGINPAADATNDVIYNTNYGYGIASDFVDHYDAFAYTSGQMTDLGALHVVNDWAKDPNYDYFASNYYDDPYYLQQSLGQAINDAGEVTGLSAIAPNAYHGFLYIGGQMYDLNNLLTGSNSTGWTVTDAVAVNTWGQVLVNASDSSGNNHVLLLSPTAPSTFASPAVSSLVPADNVAGNPDFTLAVNGSGFMPGSSVIFNGTTLTARVLSDSLAEATVPASLISKPGSYTVVMSNPDATNPYTTGTFTVYPTVLPPTFTNMTPYPIAAGAGGTQGVTLTITGSNFGSDTTVELGDKIALTPATISPDGTTLTVNIPYYYVTNGAKIPIAVINSADNTEDDGGPFGPYAQVAGPQTLYVTNPAPQITSFSPAQGAVGQSGYDLIINGTGFNGDSVVTWNNPNDGSNQATDYYDISSTQMGVYISGQDVAATANVAITVTNASETGNDGGSSTADWPIGNPPNPTPTISALYPSSAQQGAASTSLEIAGSGFVTGCTVQFGTDTLTTSQVTLTSVQATIPAADLKTAGQVTVTVTNPTPGGGVSNGLQFTINGPAVTVTGLSVNPNPVTGGSPTTGTVTLSGKAPSPNGASVTVTSDNSAATPTSPVVVPAGSTSEQFAITTTAVTTQQIANLTASYNGSASTQLTINPAVTAPNAPTGLTATAISGEEIDLSWTASAGANGYNIKRSLTSGGPYTTIAPNVAGTTFQDLGLTPNTTYYYVVSAVNSGGESANSGEANATTFPDPIILSATPGNGSVALSWTPVSGTGVTYNLYRGNQPGSEGTTPYKSNLTGTTFTDTNVTNGEEYDYYVQTSDGLSTSNQTEATPVDPNHPTVPMSLQLAAETVSSWVGHSNQFTATITNTGGAAQTISDIEVAPVGTVGSGWAALSSPLPSQPIQPGQSIQATFNLVVPSTATGGTLTNPVSVPLALQVTGAGNTVYQRDFTLNLYQTAPTTLKVQVEDTNGNPIPNALVAFDNDPNLYATNGSGQVTLPEAPGPMIAFAYATGYIPNVGASVSVSEGVQNVVTIKLQSGSALSSTLTVTTLDLQQIQNLGIDLNDDDNYTVYKFTLGLEVVYIPVPNNAQPGQQFYVWSAGGGGSGGGGGGYSWPVVTATGQNQYVIQWMDIAGEVHLLKQFFQAATFIDDFTPFPLSDVKSTINLPTSIELPDLNGQEQDEDQDVADILQPYPGETGSAIWILRGDEPGDYTINGDTTATLPLGGAKVPLGANFAGQVDVAEPEIDMHFNTPGNVTAGQVFTLGIVVTNQSSVDLQDVRVDLTKDDLVNCHLAPGQNEEIDLGTIAAGANATANFQLVSEVNGSVQRVNDYVTEDPDTLPEVKIKAASLQAADEDVSTNVGQSVTIDSLKDAKLTTVGTSLTVSYLAVSAPANGVAAIDTSTNKLVYTPNTGFVGTDTFEYSITDDLAQVSTGTVTITVNSPTLGTINLSPASASVGGGNTAVKITGSGFFAGSSVTVAGQQVSTTVVSSSEIDAIIPSSLLTKAQPLLMEVSNPQATAPGVNLGQTADEAIATFTVTGNPVPYLTSVGPNSAQQGSGPVTINLTGTGFGSGSVAKWNGTSLATTFQNSQALTAQVPASDLTGAGTANVTVNNPTPGGGTSASLPFTITASAPALSVTLGSFVKSGGNDTASVSISNSGGASATGLHISSAQLMYVSSGKLVTVAALSIMQPSSTTLAGGKSMSGSAVFAGVPTGTKVSIRITVTSDQVSTTASLAATAP